MIKKPPCPLKNVLKLFLMEMKDSLSQSVLIAQDTAEREASCYERSENIVRQAEHAQYLVDEAKQSK